MPVWSVNFVQRYVNSAAYQERVIKESCLRKDELKLQGDKAMKIMDYNAAATLYSMALKFDDADATLYSNRSLCWLRLGEGDEALSDARACTRISPEWEKGYYHQGMAFHLLQDYVSACGALIEALKLDPENPQFVNALRDALERAKCSSR